MSTGTQQSAKSPGYFHPFGLIPPGAARWAALLCLSVLSGWLGFQAWQPTLGPPTVPSVPQGIVSFELAGDEQTARAILDAWKQAGVKEAAWESLWWDQFLPAAYASTLAVALVMAAGVAPPGRFLGPRVGTALAWGMWLAMLCDYTENYALIKELEGTFGAYPAVAQVCAALKFLLVGLALVYLPLLGMKLLFTSPAPAGPGKPFTEVLADELGYVAARRAEVDLASTRAPESSPGPNLSPVERVRHEALEMDLVGLAFSGGGIRSATFNLGILQALASLKVLTRFDYLSTVSGGGYIAGWLAAWIRREPFGKGPAGEAVVPVVNVMHQLGPNRFEQASAARVGLNQGDVRDEEPQPIRHLRSYSRYLAPVAGLLSPDFWTLVAIYLRNVAINGMILLPGALAVVLLGRLVLAAFTSPPFVNEGAWLVVFLFLALLGLAYVSIFRQRRAFQENQSGPLPGIVTARKGGARAVFFQVVIPLLLAATVGAWLFSLTERRQGDYRPWAMLAGSVGLQGSPAGYGPLMTATVLDLRQLEPPSRLPRELRPLSSLGTGQQAFRRLARRVMGSLCLLMFVLLVVRWLVQFDETTTQHSAFFGFLLCLLGSVGVTYLALAVWHVGEGGFRLLLAFGVLATLVALGASLFALQFRWHSVGLVGGAACLGMAYGLAIWLILNYVLWGDYFTAPTSRAYTPYATATFGPPLFLLALTLAGWAEVAIVGRHLSEFEREWRSRLGSWLLLIALAWVGFFAITLYLPWVALQWKPSIKWGAIATWLLTTGAGAVAGRQVEPVRGAGVKSLVLTWLVALVPPLFLAGLLALVSLLLAELPDLGHWTGQREGDFVVEAQRTSVRWLAAWLGISVGLFAFMVRLINVNLFSLHALYANRLARCYLGASLRVTLPQGGAPTHVGDVRVADPFTDFSPDDDLPLACLRSSGLTVPDRANRKNHTYATRYTGPYTGPYPLFNTTLNLVADKDLAVQDRKGESFVLTPDYCGSQGTGYDRLPNDAEDHVLANLSLGRAVAISGAAADPNMNFHQSEAQTALMTVLNLRLGWWVENPRRRPRETVTPWDRLRSRLYGLPLRDQQWEARDAHFGAFLVQELLGRTTRDDEYVHLSDGGHFENLGVYELIRRRCRYIVVCDAAEDREDASENLANLMRLVLTDFGIRIEIDTTPIRKQGPDGLSRWHCAIGSIRYDDVDPCAVAGTLVFLRSSLTGDEPADLRNYAVNNPSFPHDSTADQFFTQDQFESYRALGYHIGREVFAEAVREMAAQAARGGTRDPRRETRHLFSALRQRWFPPPPDLDERYTEAAKQMIQFVHGQRTDDRLSHFTRDLHPELAQRSSRSQILLPDGSASSGISGQVEMAELHAVDQLLQIMEMTWLGAHLNGYHSHPMNRGWMNVLRRWTASEAFHRYWPMLRGDYSIDFVRFCERALNLTELPIKAVRLDCVQTVLGRAALDGEVLRPLGREFFREWAGQLQWYEEQAEAGPINEHLLHRLVDQARDLAVPGGAPQAWVLTTARFEGWDEMVRAEVEAAEAEDAAECAEAEAASAQIGIDAAWVDFWWTKADRTCIERATQRAEQVRTRAARLRACAEAAQAAAAPSWERPGSGYCGDYAAGIVVVHRLRGHRRLGLLFWVRGAYRSLGIGQESFEKILRTIRRELGREGRTLVTHYPGQDTSQAGRMQRGLWQSFFHDNGFRRRRPTPGIPDGSLELERRLTYPHHRAER